MRPLAAWLAQQERSHPNTIDLGLDRVRSVAERLRLLAPANRVITVAGTNGKGSTVAYLDALLRAAGRRTGRFTSPHLTRYNERICIDGVEATDAELIASFERIEAARGATTLTFFEYNTLAALDLFRRHAVDVAVLEVGLGGRLDATNIIDADVGIVCSIGLDHTDWLGPTLADIGREKAGIFRPDRPAVLGSTDLPRTVWEVIEAVRARPFAIGRDFTVTSRAAGWDYAFGSVQLRDLPRPPLAGALQLMNAASALTAIIAGDLAVPLTRELVSRAFGQVQLRGRFQVVPGEVEWVLDVAHNVPAAEALRAALRARPRAARTMAVCGILGDKDAAGITATLAADIDAWILAALPGTRALVTAELARQLPPRATVLAQAADVAAACATARSAARPGDRILVFGSFLTVGPALEFLGL